MPNKINLKTAFILFLIFSNAVFYCSILLIKGYPITNDIIHIFKISVIEGNLKFVNGYFGPGYTYYSLIVSSSLTILSFVIVYLSLQSAYFVYSITELIKDKLERSEIFYLYLLFLIFHLIIIISLSFNHSESLFLLLLYNGILIFIIGYYLKKKIIIYSLGVFLIGVSTIFRHQGPIIAFFLFILFLYCETFHYKKKFFLYFKKYTLIATTLAIPFIVSYLHLYLIDAFSQLLTTGKLYYFFHGERLGDWRDLKEVYQSNHYLNFRLFDEQLDHIISIIANHLRGAFFQKLYPFILCFLLAYFATKERIILFSLSIFLIYIILILPGYHFAYFPALFILYIIILINIKELIKNKSITYLIIFFLIGHLYYISNKHVSYIKEKYILHTEINNKIVPILNNNALKYSNVFSDDFEFYTNKLNGNIERLCNWGGWLTQHPYFKDYYPRKVLKGEKNKYCDIKALITRDSEFAKIYINNKEFDEYYKFNIYYLFIRE